MNMLVNGKEIVVNVEYFNKEKNDLYGDGFQESDLVYDYITEPLNKIKYDNNKQAYNLTQEQYNDMIDFLENEVECYNNGYSEYLGENDENNGYNKAILYIDKAVC